MCDAYSCYKLLCQSITSLYINYSLTKRSIYTSHADSIPEAAEMRRLAATQCLKNMVSIDTQKVCSMCLSGWTNTTLTQSAGIQFAAADDVIYIAVSFDIVTCP